MQQTSFAGHVDFWAETDDPGRSILCGWVGNPFRDVATEPTLAATLRTEAGLVRTQAAGVTYPRDDVAAVGAGLLLLCDAPAQLLAGFTEVEIRAGERAFRLFAAPGIEGLDRRRGRDAVRPLALRGGPVDHRALVLGCLSERGAGTPDGGSADHTIVVHSVIACPGLGALVLGRARAPEPNLQDLSVPKADAPFVCGHWQGGPEIWEAPFACLVNGAALADGENRLAARFANGRLAHALMPAAEMPQPPALRRVLAALPALLRREAPDAMDAVPGPAIAALHAACRKAPLAVEELRFGEAQPASISLIVPLHGRVDFMEVQLALFARQAPRDIVYVLDDPPLRAEADALAQACLAKFGVPFRLLLPSRNLGFAGASNAGFRAASGRFVCFLNSDVFPEQDDWAERLAARLEAAPRLGAAGPLLLFADGSVQHEGMVLEPLPSRFGWRFPIHSNKGLRPGPERGLAPVPAITGACMMLRRDVAAALGGFDEAYAIGDFEDSDLCQRLARLGLTCAVDRDVRALHLERQSQGAAAPWREGATLFNAWVHERRWPRGGARSAPAQPATARSGRKRAP